MSACLFLKRTHCFKIALIPPLLGVGTVELSRVDDWSHPSQTSIQNSSLGRWKAKPRKASFHQPASSVITAVKFCSCFYGDCINPHPYRCLSTSCCSRKWTWKRHIFLWCQVPATSAGKSRWKWRVWFLLDVLPAAPSEQQPSDGCQANPSRPEM